jgi:signal transduction histidine kinase
LFALIPGALAFYMYALSNPNESALGIFYFVFPLALSLFALAIIPHTRSIFGYYVVQSAVVVFYILTVPATAELPSVQIVLHIIILTEIILYEPFPMNLSESLILTAVVFVFDLLVLASSLLGGVLFNIVFIVVLPGTAISFFGSHMTKYREIVVRLVADRERLTNSVVELTRANSEYQDYAVVVREDATEMERRRITRDIHDIVGYTLTNNMMLMEAAMDLLKENALALPSIIETARENAQEGLDQVRAAMYKLREQENASPIGLNAVVRLSQIFEHATGIVVHREFGNMPLVMSDEIDSAVYHLV